MSNCIFCTIISGKSAAQFVCEDEQVVAFNDLHPQAPAHILIVPRQHIATLNDINTENNLILARLTNTAIKLAKKLGYADNGYRLIMNCNAHGEQTIFHVHLHLLAGRQLNQGMG